MVTTSASPSPTTAAPRVLTIGMLGCGTVGTGVVRLLTEHAQALASRVGVALEVGPIAVRDLARDRGLDLPTLTDDPERVLAADVDVLVEVTNGIEPARSLVRRALEAGTSVVTANKELIAAHGHELAGVATAHGAWLEYEAAVAGAVPIIRPLRQSLAGDRVRKVAGILNGTTNYILTKMTEEGVSFAEALTEAQRLGFAEADPTADVQGQDAASKTAILASLAFDAEVHGADVHREGITSVTATDIAHARRMGYVIKLLGIAEEVDGCIGLRVHPSLIPAAHPLASVRDSFNAVFVEADGAGELMFYGRGAGSLPSASAVVGDVVAVARSLVSQARPGNGAGTGVARLLPFAETVAQYYILLDVADEAGVLARVAATLGTHEVSIRSVWQEGVGDHAQLLLITHLALEHAVRSTLSDLRALPSVRDVASVMRVEDDRA